MNTIGCCSCTTYAKEKEGTIFKCYQCNRNTCHGCSGNIWRNGRWVEICKVCRTIEYLEHEGYKVIKNDQP